MTQENKELLMKDLCARLPYGVSGCFYESSEDKNIDAVISGLTHVGNNWWVNIYGSSIEIDRIKPYLFPLSSMTDEQEAEYDATFETIVYEDGRKDSVMTYKSFDWLNKNHFDYRDLIPMGLAEDVTGLNIY